MELFEASTRMHAANRVPEPDERQIEDARARFLAAIRAEAQPSRDARGSAA